MTKAQRRKMVANLIRRNIRDIHMSWFICQKLDVHGITETTKPSIIKKHMGKFTFCIAGAAHLVFPGVYERFHKKAEKERPEYFNLPFCQGHLEDLADYLGLRKTNDNDVIRPAFGSPAFSQDEWPKSVHSRYLETFESGNDNARADIIDEILEHFALPE